MATDKLTRNILVIDRVGVPYKNTAQGDLVYRDDAESTSIANMSYGVCGFHIAISDVWQLILSCHYLVNHIKRGWYMQVIESVDAQDAWYRRCNAKKHEISNHNSYIAMKL